MEKLILIVATIIAIHFLLGVIALKMEKVLLKIKEQKYKIWMILYGIGSFIAVIKDCKAKNKV